MTDFALISRKEAIGLGLKRYFTGKPCKKGHIFQRRTEKGDCVLCAQKVAAKSMMERRRSDPSYRAKEAVDQKRRYSENNSSRTKRLAAKRRWQKRYPAKVNSKCAIRRAAKVSATPSWLTKEQKREIVKVYEESANISRTTGVKYHVDHIIPLKGEFVSGLHVPWNLQIITESENCRKRNKVHE